MSYNPFNRGSAPVGVRTFEMRDDARGGRVLPVEVWYSAADRYRGQDLDAATKNRFTVIPGFEQSQNAVRDAEPAAAGRMPLVIWSHGSGSDRREGTRACTHLASHGYVVAAADHIGDTILDGPLAATYADVPAAFERNCNNRLADASFVIDCLIGGIDPAVAALIDPSRIGTGGASYGGWTSIAVNSHDRRPRAVFATVPGWGKGPLRTEFLSAQARLDDWGRPVSVFILAGERDVCVPLPGIRQLYRDLEGPKRFAVLVGSSHFHGHDEAQQRYEMARAGWQAMVAADLPEPAFDFATIVTNSPDFSQLLPAEDAIVTMQALCLAHMDEQLKAKPEAAAFLDTSLEQTFRNRGIELREVAHEEARVAA